jgi:hypothetical protein
MIISVATSDGATGERLLFVNKHRSPALLAVMLVSLGQPETWVPSTGEVTAIVKQMDLIVVDVTVIGAFNGTLTLSSSGGQWLAARNVVIGVGERKIVRFRFSFSEQREKSLS